MNPTLPTITPAPSDTRKVVPSPKQTGAEIAESGNDKSFTNHLNKAVQQQDTDNSSNKQSGPKSSQSEDQQAKVNISTGSNDDSQSVLINEALSQAQSIITSPLTNQTDFSQQIIVGNVDEKIVLPQQTLTDKPILDQQTLASTLTEKPVLSQQTFASTVTEKPVLGQQTLVSTLTENPVLSQQTLVSTLTENPVLSQQTLANNVTEKPVLGQQTLVSTLTKNPAQPQQNIVLPLQDITKASSTSLLNKESSSTGQQTSILTSQIQKILDSDGTPQQIQIRGSQKTVATSSTQTNTAIQQTTVLATVTQSSTQAEAESANTSLINGKAAISIGETTPLKGNQRFEQPTHHQENTSQFLGAKENKIAPIGMGNNNANTGFTEQGQSESLLNKASIPTTISSIGANDPLSPFAQLLTPASNTPMGLNNLHSQQQVLMPSGTLVYEEQVMQQVHQQFNATLAGKAQSTVNIRLTPAELGELKIDLTIKEGSVRVNVVAHSQQAQEILERNMPKLKGILEDQGLSIDEISVTQASKFTDDFNLFDEQFAGGKGYSQENSKNSSTFSQFNDSDLTDLPLHESNIDSANSTGGVNLTI